MPRRLTFSDLLTISGLAAFVCAVMLFSIYRGPEYGLPKNDKLISASGRLIYAGRAPAGRNSHTTIFRLDSSPDTFEFTMVMGDQNAVLRALCVGCEASVWTDPDDRRDRPFAWQIAVNGKTVASYPDVKAHWINDQRDAYWLAPFAGVISIGFAVWAFRRRRHPALPYPVSTNPT